VNSTALRTRNPRPVVLLLAAALLAACGSSSKGAAPTTTGAATPTTANAATAAAGPTTTTGSTTCQSNVAAPTAAAVAGKASDFDLTSFDGTKIRVHWFPLPGATAATPAPTVLQGPGWAGAGDQKIDKTGLDGGADLGALRQAGYNVLTWDPRGFGVSGGAATIDSPEFEGKDVMAIISWVATQPGVQLDGPGDPRMGMVGASYGGGIQFVTAQQDCRIDAIVPIIGWHSLTTSLDKAGIYKISWGSLLVAAATGKQLDPHIPAGVQQVSSTGTLTTDEVAWLSQRGPGDLVSKITVPTLIIQGTVDTLFTLDEAVSNFSLLKKAGTTVAMQWFCGGHGQCLTKAGDTTRVGQAALAWLNRYVKKDTSAPTAPAFETVDQNGISYTGAEWPLPAGPSIEATGSGTLPLVAEGGAGPAKGAALPIFPGQATNAVTVPITIPAAGFIAGAPSLTISYSGTVPAGDKPTAVFAQIVDTATGLALGNQITPIPVTLDGAAHDLTVPLELVAWSAQPTDKLALQIVATTPAYAQPRLGGQVTFTAIKVSLPTVTGLAKR
jgi:ABC-2 type transport system ATP-binding protein